MYVLHTKKAKLMIFAVHFNSSLAYKIAQSFQSAFTQISLIKCNPKKDYEITVGDIISKL